MNYMQVPAQVQKIVADANFLHLEDMIRWQRVCGKLFAIQECLVTLGKLGRSVEAKILIDFCKDYSGMYPEIGTEYQEEKCLRLRFCRIQNSDIVDGVELRLDLSESRVEWRVTKLSTLFGTTQISNLNWRPEL